MAIEMQNCMSTILFAYIAHVAVAITSSSDVTTHRDSPPWHAFNVTVPAFWFGGPIPENVTSLETIAKYATCICHDLDIIM
eukprot:m.106123 g.106123  ORF g.106123 m.106123 type:complete len:81 (-) comp27701_c0_seq3:1446-1688(-)